LKNKYAPLILQGTTSIPKPASMTKPAITAIILSALASTACVSNKKFNK